MTVPVSEPSPSPSAPSVPPRPAGRRGGAFAARWAPLVLPFAYLAVILALQPADHMGPPELFPDSGQVIYDDYDISAMVLRGLNAHLGRRAGRLDLPPHISDEDFRRALAEDRPLEPTYYLEYPHAALWIFRLGFLLQPPLPRVPAVLLDGSYGNLLYHRPDNDEDRTLWRALRRAATIYRCLMGVCLVALLLTLRAGYEGELRSGGWLFLLPGVVYFTFNRFDIVPALLTALSLACLGRRRLLASGALLAAATTIKVYPVLLVPLFVRYLWPRRRETALWLSACAAAALLFLVPPLLTEGPQSLWAPFQFQLNRVPDGLSAYGHVLPVRLAENDLVGRAFRMGTLALVVGLLAWPRLPDLASLLRRGAVVLVVFLSLAVFYSPQWNLWLIPLLFPLTRRRPGLVVLLVVLDLITVVTFPLWLGWMEWLPEEIDARFALLSLLVLYLLWAERRGRNDPLTLRGDPCDDATIRSPLRLPEQPA